MLKNFVKRYGYYLLAFSLVLAIGISVGLSDGGVVPPAIGDGELGEVSTTPIEMVSPLNDAEVLKWYSDTELFYNSTLKQWESHRGVDLTSNASGDVVAALDGTISDCSYSYEDGYCITITHGNGLTTTYCSLKDVDAVKEGDKVTKGQKIGEISNSSAHESNDGNHLHFSVCLNGNYVDPANYITFENK